MPSEFDLSPEEVARAAGPGRKVVVAANPWRLAAEAKRRGIPESLLSFVESDLVADDVLLFVDPEALERLPDDLDPRLRS